MYKFRLLIAALVSLLVIAHVLGIDSDSAMQEGDFDARCDRDSLCAHVREVAHDLESRRLLYNSAKLTDCSGIFHRFLDALEERCPRIDNPPVDPYRSTRDLAYWYHQQDRLDLVRDAEDHRDRIRPGAVMFYGTRGKRYRRFDLDDLLDNPGGIQHVGVVTKVYEIDGNLTYDLFHGRSSGKVAGITSFHRLRPSREHLPPLGNWDQQWVAIATLTPGGRCR